MKINKNTRISTLINENKDTIDVIASINKNFKKLKNPILRKVLAPRVTIADAAKVGGVSIEVLLEKLRKIGFEFEGNIDQVKSEEETHSEKHAKQDIPEKDKMVFLDVRPTLDSGKDPFDIIMKTVKVLKDDETLKIINTFEPIPLIRKLQAKGYESWTERPDDGTVVTYFRKNNSQWVDDEVEKTVKKSKKSFEEVLTRFADHIRRIDVRELEMPEPMVTILKEIETLKEGEALYVDHKKIPQFLLPELEQRNFEILYKEIDCNHTVLLIYKEEGK
ncbi:MAG: hypothetical protein DSY82_05515 [Flavobacteriia bacterium]|nr:MAG: hypothetical protein DSY82_05515 [Flavobacteriia bacterium]